MSLKVNALHRWRRITQVGFGIFFVNGYIPVIWNKMLYSGPLRSICVPVLNCHSCPTALMACPIGMLQSYASLHQFPYFVLGFLGFSDVNVVSLGTVTNYALAQISGFFGFVLFPGIAIVLLVIGFILLYEGL